jgi:tetratricopeptide (TPR) repeat protein
VVNAALGAKLEAMGTENRQIAEEKPSEPPSDSELFAVEVHDEHPDREIFTGDEDFFKQLANTKQTATAQETIRASQSPPVSVKRRRFSTIQIILLISIVMTAAMLSYGLFKSASRPGTRRLPTPTNQIRLGTGQKSPAKLLVESIHRPAPQLPKELGLASPPIQGLSLNVAETLYQEKYYREAFAAYDQLSQALTTSPQEDLIKDFLQLRMALCAKEASDLDQANTLFRALLQSRSPIIRLLANYHLSLLAIQSNQYLKAQTRAYQAIALIDAVNSDADWAARLRCNCHFLVAESITRNVLTLSDADKDLPPKLWSGGLVVDPFTNLTEAELRLLLNSGIDQ